MNKEKRVIICMVIVTMLSGGCAGTRNDVSTENEISTDADNNVVTAEELSTGGAWEEKHGYYDLKGRGSQEFVEYCLGEGAYNKEPYASYVNQEGKLQMELWYREDSQLWCGVRYALDENDNTYGFLIDEKADINEVEWEPSEAVDAILSPDDFISQQVPDGCEIENLKEEREYDDEGRLLSYQVTGDYIAFGEFKESEYLYSITYTYYDNGMIEKAYDHNVSHFGTMLHYYKILYDENGRDIYQYEKIALEPSAELYNIYEGDSDSPSCTIIIDGGVQGVYPTLIIYTQTKEEKL